MKEDRVVPLKNYILLAVTLIISIVIVIYFYMWYGEFESNRVNTSVMDNYLSVINYNELDAYLVENKDAVLYVSALNNTDIRNFENRFKQIISKYSLNNKILYLNLTNEYKDNELYNDIKNKYSILDMPCIIIFKDNQVDDVYSIKNRNYDIDLLVSYLKIKDVIYD